MCIIGRDHLAHLLQRLRAAWPMRGMACFTSSPANANGHVNVVPFHPKSLRSFTSQNWMKRRSAGTSASSACRCRRRCRCRRLSSHTLSTHEQVGGSDVSVITFYTHSTTRTRMRTPVFKKMNPVQVNVRRRSGSARRQQKKTSRVFSRCECTDAHACACASE